jgi:membrane protease YdiL (CAAX protease family)
VSSALRALLRDRTLVAFFTLSIALSWAYWIPVAIAGGRASHFPGLLGALIAAALVSARDVRRQLTARVALRWCCLALAPLAVLAAVGLAQTVTGDGRSWASFADMPGLPAWPWPAVFAAVLVVNGFGEETGWRGCAWTRLRRGLSLRDAALVLTVPWAIWHLPLFWIDSGLADLPLAVVPGWLVGLAAGAVVLGWLYERSGSLLVVALAHTAVNMASGTRGAEGLAAGVVTAAVIAAAIALLARSERDERMRPHELAYDGVVA